MMSARANPYHNAWTESFMGTLKNEMLQGGCVIDDTEARMKSSPTLNPTTPIASTRRWDTRPQFSLKHSFDTNGKQKLSQ